MSKREIKKIDIFPERLTDYGKYRVYRNLHQDCWSVKCFEYGSPDYNRVVCHAQEVFLEKAKYIVSHGGFQKVHKEKRKNVHAFVEGYPIQKSTLNDRIVSGRESEKTVEKYISYNPYVCHRFHYRDNDTKFPTLEYRGQFVEGLLYIYNSDLCYLNLHRSTDGQFKADVLAIWNDEKSFLGHTHLQRDTSMLPIAGNYVPIGA